MKICLDCKEEITRENEVLYRRRGKVTVQPRCRPCQRERQRGYMESARRAKGIPPRKLSRKPGKLTKLSAEYLRRPIVGGA